jgi:hypothetical protein
LTGSAFSIFCFAAHEKRLPGFYQAVFFQRMLSDHELLECLSYLAPLVELNVAVTAALRIITTVQVLDLPEHAPDQPANVEFAPAVAVRVTYVPAL